MTFAELYKKTTELNREELLANGVKSFEQLRAEMLSEGIPEDEVDRDILEMVAVFVSVDRFSSKQEFFLFKKVFGDLGDYDAFVKFAQRGIDDEYVQKVIKGICGLNQVCRASACNLCLCFIASDGEIEPNESALLEKLIG